MKRILIITLALLCIFSFSACGKDNAYDLYSDATKKLEEANGGEFNMTTKTTVTVAGKTESYEIKMNVKTNGNNMTITSEDSEIMPFTSATYIDGVLYMETDAGKIKSTVSLEDLDDELGSFGTTNTVEQLPDLTEDKLKDIELTEEDGIRSFTTTLTMDELKPMMEGMGMDFDEMPEGLTFTATIKVSFDKKDNMTGYSLSINMGMTEDEYTISYVFDIACDFVNPGTAPTITAPADAADYVSAD